MLSKRRASKPTHSPAQLRPSCSAIKAIFNSVLSMALSDAAETRPSLAQEFSNLMLQLTSYSKQGQAKVVWDLGAKHAGAVSVGAILPMAGSFRALYLSLRAKGVRVLLRSSLPMICYKEINTLLENKYVSVINSDLFLTFVLP